MPVAATSGATFMESSVAAMAVMGLAVKGGDTVTVTVQGSDEEQAATALRQWLQEHLGKE